MNDAYNIFFGEDDDNGALKHCLATRLNVLKKELGWYSDIDLKLYGTHKLWQHWQMVHYAYLNGQPETAKKMCNAINKIDPAS